MQAPNYHRMFDLIDEVFSTRNDPNQLLVNEDVIQKLNSIHPATLTELADDNGPLIWVLYHYLVKLVQRIIWA